MTETETEMETKKEAEKEKDRETMIETERDRETERQRDRETETETDRETERERDKDREKEKKRKRQTDFYWLPPPQSHSPTSEFSRIHFTWVETRAKPAGTFLEHFAPLTSLKIKEATPTRVNLGPRDIVKGP